MDVSTLSRPVALPWTNEPPRVPPLLEARYAHLVPRAATDVPTIDIGPPCCRGSRSRNRAPRPRAPDERAAGSGREGCGLPLRAAARPLVREAPRAAPRDRHG